ncbi:MAG: bifunctional methylenetetrahydrofolate dehydrogenase/methenyltetrahydrofolate cyclohydrolase [Alphaproteobacteria bacterium CG_4_9_14_3_um_filter_47_13]|nr:MAG: bifunctional methylenetetrahydrofolate dehydrogenase/methenyltetrahydrofolate cyclohydrolase [Alphaproteobacteria bacterium CG_4_9_14_3_um_filter_47_13]
MNKNPQTHIIDGKSIAARLRETLAEEITRRNLTPGLAVILVGDDPASHVYVRNKMTACEKTGIKSFEHRLGQDSRKEDIAALITALNNDSQVHGILLQLPLPPALAMVQDALIQMIAPHKDVDGLTVTNAGKLILGMPDGMVPCTPQGSLLLIKEIQKDLTGCHAVIIGRSSLFGKPMGQLLLAENCTVTQCHSKTRDLPSLCRQADILVVAVGRPHMVKGDWIKPGAIVIDVGINRTPEGTLVGDVDFDEAVKTAAAITPVPGGVGPMTIACLLRNTVRAAGEL